jgi:FlaA1/EpsC-like NDP-sugar epimerase
MNFKNIKFWAVLSSDIVLLFLAHLLSYLIRFEGELGPSEWDNIRAVLPLFILLKISVFSSFGLYKGMWRYTSMVDLLNILKACLLTSFIAMSVLLLVSRFIGFSRAVFILDGLLTFLFIVGSRVAIRIYYQRSVHFSFGTGRSSARQRVRNLLLVGAGDAAEKVVREIVESRSGSYQAVGLLDDNRSKWGQRIHGVPIVGGVDELSVIVEKVKVDEILIAIPSASREEMSRVVDACQQSGVPYKTLPGLDEIIDGKVTLDAVREVSYKDLLGRPPVELELDKIGEILTGKTVLVTGAGGSIGSELCRQILRFSPGKLLLFDAGELNLYQIEMELLHEIGFKDYVTVLGKVQDKELLNDIFARYQPSVVFHAAAYKHVPMLERNPWEAVNNNITATRCLAEAAVRSGVDRFILVSTDKAVRPTNVMGASKRITELIMQSYCASGAGCPAGRKGGAKTRFMAVRFGNVLGSSGSVIPLFKRQIELGGPVTVTDPRMTRYFMSIEEAAQLILQAAAMNDDEVPLENRVADTSCGGEIFILQMGTPVKIDQMARDLIKLCGREPDQDIQIIYTGLRPGEKLYEELITEGEGIVPTGHKKIMVLKSEDSNVKDISSHLDELESLARDHDGPAIKAKIAVLVPEYQPAEEVAVL